MSQIFHKSCYTARSTGYKYRTLSTNTGEKKRRDSKEDTTFERKFTELQREITSRIVKEVDNTQRTRQSIQDKFEIVEAKINTMLDVQSLIQSLRQDLGVAEIALSDIVRKVEKIEESIGVGDSTTSSFVSGNSFNRLKPFFDCTKLIDSPSKEVIDSTIANI